jgi:hypothetical protein
MKALTSLFLILNLSSALAIVPGLNCTDGKISYNGQESGTMSADAEITQAPNSSVLILSQTDSWVGEEGKAVSLSLHSEVVGYSYNEETKLHTYKVLMNYSTNSDGRKREPLEFTVDASKVVRVIPDNPSAKLYLGSFTVVDPLGRFTMKRTYECTVRNFLRDEK